MPRKSDAREKMIETATELFRARGYHGVGLTEILEKSGAPKGSFYHHFPNGKEQLALAVVERGGRFISKLISKAFDGVKSVEEGVNALVVSIAKAFQHSGFELGCPVTPLLLDMAPANKEVRVVANTVIEHWTRRLMDHARQLKVSDQLLPDYERAFRALVISIEGGWIISRTTHTIEPILLAGEVFRTMLPNENRPDV